MDATSVTLPGAPRKTRDRYPRIFSALGTAIVGKGSVLLLNAITVPIAVRYLGAEEYGLWVTIATTITMLVVLDIGIANTLTNLISEAYASNDRTLAGEYFSTSFLAMIVISVVLGLLGWTTWPYVNLGYLLNVHDSVLLPIVSRAIEVAFILFLIGLPAGLASKTFGGYQELHIANLFIAGGSVLGLIAIAAAVLLKGSLVALVAAYAGATVAASVGCLGWMIVKRPWLAPTLDRFRSHHLKRIFHSGGQFFLIQIAGLVVFNSDNLVISHFLSPAEVTPYNVTWRLATYATALQALGNPALWPAYSEAWAARQIGWIRQAYRRVRWITIGTMGLACAVLVPFGREIIRIWAGPTAVPSMALLVAMCIWMVLYAVTLNQAALMGATFRMGKQAVASLVAASANLALSIWWVHGLGAAGVILGTVVSYLIFIVAVQMWEVRQILREPGEANA